MTGNKNNKWVWGIVATFVIIIAANRQASALQVVDTNYTAQVYATYASPGIGNSMGMAFDDSGNLFVTQRGDSALNFANGSIYKIAPGGSASRWVENIAGPRRIVWGGGTAYGDNLYVAESEPDEYILQVTTSGSVTPFARIDRFGNDADTTHPLAIDRSGTYGNLMYAATRGTQGIYTVSTAGSDSLFSTFPPQPTSGGPLDFAFDPGLAFGGSLYMAIESTSTNGIYSIDTNGNGINFAPNFDGAADIEIDVPNGIFGGNMLAYAHDVSSTWAVWNIDPSGNSTQLLNIEGRSIVMSLGPDGNLYVAEYISENDLVNIYQVTEIPEPLSLSLLSMGGLWLTRRKKRV